jgi:Holliday junction resolvase
LNHATIVRTLRDVHWTVVDMARVGDGFPDVIAVRRGRVRFCEIKGPQGRLTADQVRVHALLERAGGVVVILKTVEDAVWLS